MKIHTNVQKRSLKWIITLLLIVGIVWLTLEVFSLSFELVSTTVTGCLENEECLFKPHTHVTNKPPERQFTSTQYVQINLPNNIPWKCFPFLPILPGTSVLIGFVIGLFELIEALPVNKYPVCQSVVQTSIQNVFWTITNTEIFGPYPHLKSLIYVILFDQIHEE